MFLFFTLSANDSNKTAEIVHKAGQWRAFPYTLYHFQPGVSATVKYDLRNPEATRTERLAIVPVNRGDYQAVIILLYVDVLPGGHLALTNGIWRLKAVERMASGTRWLVPPHFISTA